jgi:hypothetical protein
MMFFGIAEVVGSTPTTPSIFIYEGTTVLNYVILDNCSTILPAITFRPNTNVALAAQRTSLTLRR